MKKVDCFHLEGAMVGWFASSWSVDWQPAQSQTVWECWINTRSEKLGTSELEFGASNEKMHVGERCSLF